MHQPQHPTQRITSRKRLTRAIFPDQTPTAPTRYYRLRTIGPAGPADVITLIAHITRPFILRALLTLANQGAGQQAKTDVLISTDAQTDAGALLRDQHASLNADQGAGFAAHIRAPWIPLNLTVSRNDTYLKIVNHVGTANPIDFHTNLAIEPL